MLLILTVSADNSFNYNKNVVGYLINKRIENIVPSVNLKGIYSVSPPLVDGLELDKYTGVISGIPKERVNTNYTITFISDDTHTKSTSVIHLSGMFIYFIY